MTTKAEILRSIRRKCLDCCVYQRREVRLCAAYTCDLWPFRMGSDPNPARRGFAVKPSVQTDYFHQEKETDFGDLNEKPRPVHEYEAEANPNPPGDETKRIWIWDI